MIEYTVGEHDIDPETLAAIAQLIKEETNWTSYNGRSYGNIRPTLRVLAFDTELVACMSIFPLPVLSPSISLVGFGGLVVANHARGRGIGTLLVSMSFEAVRDMGRHILTSTSVGHLQHHLRALGFYRVPAGVVTWEEEGAVVTKDRFFAWTFDGSLLPPIFLQTGRF